MALDEARRLRRRRQRRRLVGALLLIYGVAGLAFIAVLGMNVSRPLDDIGTLTVSLEEQRDRLRTSLQRTSDTLGSASDAARSFDTSLTSGRNSAVEAAALARDAAITMDGLAEAMRVQIFGTQPLANLAGGFTRSASQLRDLGTDLDGVGTALGQGTDALNTTVDDLAELRESVDELTESLDETQGLSIDSTGVAALRLGLIGLATWLGGLAVGCVVAGAAVWRSATRLEAVL